MSARRWRLERRSIRVRGEELTLRLTAFSTGWLASVDTVEGPTLGCDRSPYLAVAQALEPLGVPLETSLVGALTLR